LLAKAVKPDASLSDDKCLLSQTVSEADLLSPHPISAYGSSTSVLAPTRETTPVGRRDILPETDPNSQTVTAVVNTRIDYLAGLTTFVCLFVTVIHFFLTFLPGAIEIGYNSGIHGGNSQLWASKIVFPLMSIKWVGTFFQTMSVSFVILTLYLPTADASNSGF
jgi:hypothetical protein